MLNDEKIPRNKVSMKFQRSSDVVKRRTCSRTCPKIRIYILTTPASWKIEFPSSDRCCELLAVLISVDVSGSLSLCRLLLFDYYPRSSMRWSYATRRRSTAAVQMVARLIKRRIDDARATIREDSLFVKNQSTEEPDRWSRYAISFVF